MSLWCDIASTALVVHVVRVHNPQSRGPRQSLPKYHPEVLETAVNESMWDERLERRPCADYCAS